MNRRDLLRLSASAAGLAVLSAACGPLRLGAHKMRQLGILSPDDGLGPRWDAFQAGLRDQGWIDGENIALVWRRAYADTNLLGGLAAELAGMSVDVLVTGGTEAAAAALRASHTIPIVVTSVNDPIGSGLIASFARPGGNLTGSALLSPQLTPKWMELVGDLIPGLGRLAMLANHDNPSTAGLVDQMRGAAPPGVQLRVLDIRSIGDLADSFEMAHAWGAEALLVLPDYLFYSSRARVARQAAEHRIPTLYSSREYVEAGGLLSYGANQVDLYRRAAGFVDRILNGARAADLPFEQPSTFELVANMTVAQQLGLTFPRSIALQAAVIS